jgi:microcystin degradation protein MlrC
MRIAIGQLWQETNTFNPIPTTRAHFEQVGVTRGEDMIASMVDTNELGGFIQSLRAWPERPEVVGLARLPAWPGGTATRETLQWLLAEMLDPLRKHLPVDAVLLALHGSLVADGTPDVEGELLQRVRELIGPQAPLVATLDLHANVTERMVQSADALVLYHTAPHIDVFETGKRGAHILRRILIDGARPRTAFRKLPLVVPAERANTQDPVSVSCGFRRRLQEIESDRRVLAAGLATVQPWLDIPELGSAVVIVTDGNENLADSYCRDFAGQVWGRRHDYLPELVSIEDAVRAAHANQDGLAVLSDSADSTTSGAPGDSTWLLAELLKYDWQRLALVPMVAPEAVEAAYQHGEGGELTMKLGGKRDTRFSRPIELTVHVKKLFQAKFVMSGHLARNLPIDMGSSAVLRTGHVHVLATTYTGPHFAPQFFQCAQLDPFAASVLIAKSPCGFRAAYQDRAKLILVVRAPGCAPSDFWNYEYRNIPRPMWPWDDL